MIKKVLLWIWQLPQNLVAVIILLIHHKEVQKVILSALQEALRKNTEKDLKNTEY